jgi:hypothetical protein
VDASEVQEYEAPIEIVNIGIWLYENGHFKDLKLLIYWIFYGVFPILSVSALVFGAYIEVDFYSTLMVTLGVNKDYQRVKDEVCNREFYKTITFLTFYMLAMMSISEKLILLVKPKGSIFFKILILL